MYIQLCDRCGVQTENKPAFLLPVTEDKGSYRVENQWFGNPITLYNDCLKDFDDFRYKHKFFRIHFVEETHE